MNASLVKVQLLPNRKILLINNNTKMLSSVKVIGINLKYEFYLGLAVKVKILHIHTDVHTHEESEFKMKKNSSFKESFSQLSGEAASLFVLL